MSTPAAQLRAARTAGVRRDRAGLVLAVHVWVEAMIDADAWWARTGTLGTAVLEPIEAAMLLLAGRGRATSAVLARRLVFVDANPDDSDRVRPFADVPTDELDNYSLRELAWIRLLGADWQAVPPTRPRRGKLVGPSKRADALARRIVTAFAARDRDLIVAAIHAAEGAEKSRRFSLFGFALAEQARQIGVEPGIAAYTF